MVDGDGDGDTPEVAGQDAGPGPVSRGLDKVSWPPHPAIETTRAASAAEICFVMLRTVPQPSRPHHAKQMVLEPEAKDLSSAVVTLASGGRATHRLN